MIKAITKDSVIAHLVKDGWSNEDATNFCDRYYDLAPSKGKHNFANSGVLQMGSAVVICNR